ncbi:MAG: LPS export ABC transporter periplasmic protein LptC [Pseudomonadales bacterium]
MIVAKLAASKRVHATLALVIVLIGVRVWERSGDGTLSVVEVAKEEVADNYSTDITALQFNEAGVLQYHLHAEQAAHYLHTDTALVQRPILLSYGEDGTIWRSVANHGKVRAGGDIVDLWDNVVIRRTDDSARITTDEVTFNTLKGDADTAAKVTITTPTSQLQGIGMHANINTEIVNLLDDVRGTYGLRAP